MVVRDGLMQLQHYRYQGMQCTSCTAITRITARRFRCIFRTASSRHSTITEILLSNKHSHHPGAPQSVAESFQVRFGVVVWGLGLKNARCASLSVGYPIRQGLELTHLGGPGSVLPRQPQLAISSMVGTISIAMTRIALVCV